MLVFHLTPRSAIHQTAVKRYQFKQQLIFGCVSDEVVLLFEPPGVQSRECRIRIQAENGARRDRTDFANMKQHCDSDRHYQF